MLPRWYTKPHSVGLETVKSSSGLLAARCLARASLRRLDFKFQLVRSANIARSARDVPAAVNQAKNTSKDSQGGKQENEDPMSKRLTSLRSGGRSILVAHSAALRQRRRRERRAQDHKGQEENHRESNCQAAVHAHINKTK